MKKLIGSAIGILTLFSFMFGYYQYNESRYARAEETKQSIQSIQQTQKKESKRLDYKILSDQLRSLQERIWKIQDRIEQRKTPPDETTKEELRSLEISKVDAQKKLDILEKEIK